MSDQFVKTSSSDAAAVSNNAVDSPSLLRLLSYSMQMLGQYFPMVYPVFGYFLLMGILLPHGVPQLQQWTWWAVYGGVFLLMFLFRAGWNAVYFNAVQRWLLRNGLGNGLASKNKSLVTADAVPEIPLNFFDSFAILKDFLPGIGAYGVDFLLASVVELLVLAVPLALAGIGAYVAVGVPQQYLIGGQKILQEAFTSQGPISNAKLSAFVNSLPERELEQLAVWFLLLLAGFVVAALIEVCLQYWQPILRRDNCNALQAMWRSVKIAGKHPFASLSIWLYFNFSFLMLTLLMALGDFGAVLGHFINILFMALMGCFLFLFLHFRVSPVFESEAPAANTTLD